MYMYINSLEITYGEMWCLPAASCERAVTAISRLTIPSAIIIASQLIQPSHTETKRQTMGFQKSGDF